MCHNAQGTVAGITALVLWSRPRGAFSWPLSLLHFRVFRLFRGSSARSPTNRANHETHDRHETKRKKSNDISFVFNFGSSPPGRRSPLSLLHFRVFRLFRGSSARPPTNRANHETHDRNETKRKKSNDISFVFNFGSSPPGRRSPLSLLHFRVFRLFRRSSTRSTTDTPGLVPRCPS